MPTPRGADRLLILAACLLAGLFAVRALQLLRSPYPSEYGEGTTWTYAHLLETRGTYFLPIQSEPYIHATYPPLFPRLQTALGGSLAAGRLVALLATLLAAAVVARMVASTGVRPRRAVLWAVVFLGAPSVHEWAALCRVDTLALGLSLLGLAVADRARGELLAAPIFAAAFFAKQIALAAPAAVFLSLIVRREPRRAWIFAALYGGLVLTTFAILDWRSGGEVRRHLITYTAFPGFAPGELLSWSLRYLFAFPVLLALGLSRWRELMPRPVALYVPLALLTIILAGKPGAGANYLLEASAAIVIAGGIAAERRLAELERSPERRRDLVLLLVVQFLILCGPGRILELRALLREDAVAAAATSALHAADGPVLAEDLGLTLAAGKEPMLEPFQFGLLAEAGMFDPTPVVHDLERGKFGAVLAGTRLYRIPGLATALGQRYRVGERIGPYDLWQPLAARAGSPPP